MSASRESVAVDDGVEGAPYRTPRPADAVPETPALAWAARHVAIDGASCTRDAPWGRLYRLGRRPDANVLAVTPPAASVAPELLPRLAERFGARVPAPLAADADRGLLLTRAVAGRRLDYDLAEERLVALLRDYAHLQAASVGDAGLLAGLPRLDVGTQLAQLIDFLRPGGRLPEIDGARTAADELCGRETADRYGRPLRRRREMLETYLARAAELPLALEHGDLRPPNVWSGADGRCVFAGWDDACAAPIGASLHGLFSGCATPARLLGGDVPGDAWRAGRELIALESYVDALVETGCAERATLHRALGASACAGMIRHLLGFSRFDLSGSDRRREVREIFVKRLGDLLDLCDALSLGERPLLVEHVDDYVRRGRRPRAEAMLGEHLRRCPNDAGAHARYADLLQRRGSHRRAARHFREASEIAPDDAGLACRHAAARLETLDLDGAVSLYRHALHVDPGHAGAAGGLEEALSLRDARRDAGREDTLPRIVVSSSERERGRMSRAKLALAEALFLEHGTLVIENVYDDALIGRCREEVLGGYRAYFENVRHEDALRIGDRRFQVTVSVEGPFNDEAFYANPLLMPLLHRWLDEKFVLGSLTASVSLPGAKLQWSHKDHPRIFSRRDEEPVLPPVGVSVMIPLIDLDWRVGTTRVQKGSHRVSLDASRRLPSLSPYVAAGSCFLLDHRLSHTGEPNRSREVRPILNMLYHRRWFRDSLNFRDQPPVRVPAEELEKVPAHLRRLLRWTGDPDPRR